jgi:hypothetical protein
MLMMLVMTMMMMMMMMTRRPDAHAHARAKLRRVRQRARWPNQIGSEADAMPVDARTKAEKKKENLINDCRRHCLGSCWQHVTSSLGACLCIWWLMRFCKCNGSDGRPIMCRDGRLIM